MENFYYRVGPVETTTPWERPNYYSMKAFFNDALNSSIGKKYDLYMYGGILQELPTWDIDVAVRGEIDYTKTFEDDLANLYDLALNKHSLLLDAAWMNRNMVKDKYIDAKDRNFIHPDTNATREVVRFYDSEKRDTRNGNTVDVKSNLKSFIAGNDLTNNLMFFNYPQNYRQKIVDKYRNVEYIIKEPVSVKDFVFYNKSWYESNI